MPWAKKLETYHKRLKPCKNPSDILKVSILQYSWGLKPESLAASLAEWLTYLPSYFDPNPHHIVI
jgi:hypothetical protein